MRRLQKNRRGRYFSLPKGRGTLRNSDVEGGFRVRQTGLGWEIHALEVEIWTYMDDEPPAIGIVAVTGGWQSWSRC
jgi:hypothetical protein